MSQNVVSQAFALGCISVVQFRYVRSRDAKNDSYCFWTALNALKIPGKKEILIAVPEHVLDGVCTRASYGVKLWRNRNACLVNT